MSRREVRIGYPPQPLPPPSQPSTCAKVLYYTWKLCSVVFSHFVMISLVVAYCVLGAVTFEKLEAHNEREVKKNISQIRGNTTQHIWSMTNRVSYLNQVNWTSEVVDMLKDFENSILLEMKVRGWDGNESTDHLQWTFTGALFYSIIVVTTIGYGHIAPKTQTGKVVTILYAILGIPLMLLCLSNIGDVMASSFRFLYWRVCCYVCTRPPKRRHRHRSARRSLRAASSRGSSRRRRPLVRAHSDTDCRYVPTLVTPRYRDSGYNSGRARRARAAPPPRTRSQPPQPQLYGPRVYDIEDRSPTRGERYVGEMYHDEDEFPKISLPLSDLHAALKDLEDYQMKAPHRAYARSKSLPRPSKSKSEFGPRRDFVSRRHYELDDEPDTYEMHDLHDVDYENYRERRAIEERDKKGRARDNLVNRDIEYDPEDADYEFDVHLSRGAAFDRRSEYDRNVESHDGRRGRRARSAVYDYERREEEVVVDRDIRADRRRLRRLQTIDDGSRPRYSLSPGRDDWSDVAPPLRRGRPPGWGSRTSDVYAESYKEELKPVPIWLCVFLVASYIVAGTFLFKRWEGWAYLDAAYFCFITLTTIGFGDFVPAQGQIGDPADAVHSIALCSLYLLFGIALLAMSFNLVQEEVRANVAELATRLGIIKPEYSDDEY